MQARACHVIPNATPVGDTRCPNPAAAISDSDFDGSGIDIDEPNSNEDSIG